MKRKGIFDDILYAQCWEDPDLDRAAFRIAPGDVVFTITSGGCNALAFLADGPSRVIAVDLNPYQNYLLDLKMAAFRQLAYPEVLEFVGVRESRGRMAMYRTLRPLLSPPARIYWDAQQEKISAGLLHAGRYERYMGLLRTWTRAAIGGRVVDRFFEEDDPHARAELFRTHWDTWGWKLLTRALLSRTTMTVLFTGAFFRYVEGDFSFGEHFAKRVKRALTELSPRDNPYLAYILLGRYYDEEHLPPYLRRENYEQIRDGIDRIECSTSACDEYFRRLPDSTVSHFNFTNIFEWMPQETFESLLCETWRVAKDGATLTYRNLLVHRERPDKFAHLIASRRDLARTLHDRDRSFIYRNYVVEHVMKETHPWTTTSARCVTAEH